MPEPRALAVRRVENLKTSYDRFLKETNPSTKEEAGKDLIRAMFGADSIAEDPIL
jgi:hypothetical protein